MCTVPPQLPPLRINDERTRNELIMLNSGGSNTRNFLRSHQEIIRQHVHNLQQHIE